MKRFEQKEIETPAYERFSRRTKDGVEIVEHERHQVIRVNGGRYETLPAEPRPEPRLVISETPSAAGLFVSKARSEIAGLDAVLSSLLRTPVKAK